MTNEALRIFLEKVSEDSDLRSELVALAARYGLDLDDDELSDDQLSEVSGGLYRRTVHADGESSDDTHGEEIEVLR